MTEETKDEFVTQSETGEPAAVDEVEGRVEAETKRKATGMYLVR